MDCLYAEFSEYCYGSINITNCYKCYSSQNLENCSNVYLSSNLINCENCIACMNMANKAYYIFNKHYSESEYQIEVQRL
jgi:hypothetical protein